MTKKNTYQELGASASKSGLHSALEQAGLEQNSGLFAQVNSDLAGATNYHSFLHCDGAGTKSIAAYLAYRETGDINYFAGLAQDALVMNLDDVFCIGKPESLLLANTIGRNSRLISDDAIAVIIKEYKSLVDNLRTQGIEIELSGGETADLGDLVRTVLVDSVLAGRIKKDNLVNTNNIQPGDVIVGLSSTGQATYENKANSGIASNGLTLARHTLLKHEYAEKYPEIVDPELDKSKTYQGPYSIEEIAKELLSPTRTYAPIISKTLDELKKEIHGIIHVTGGALTKVLRFGQGNHYIKDNLFETPKIFSLIQKSGNIDWQEMYQVFNMGQRLEIYLPEKHLKTVTDIATEFQIDAKQIGYVDKNDSKQNKVTVKSKNGEFTYSL